MSASVLYVYKRLTDWLEAVKEAEVEAAVDEDAGAGNPEPAIQTQQAVRSEG